MAETKYLDYEGLECLVSQLKNYVNSKSDFGVTIKSSTIVFDNPTKVRYESDTLCIKTK